MMSEAAGENSWRSNPTTEKGVKIIQWLHSSCGNKIKKLKETQCGISLAVITEGSGGEAGGWRGGNKRRKQTARGIHQYTHTITVVREQLTMVGSIKTADTVCRPRVSKVVIYGTHVELFQ